MVDPFNVGAFIFGLGDAKPAERRNVPEVLCSRFEHRRAESADVSQLIPTYVSGLPSVSVLSRRACDLFRNRTASRRLCFFFSPPADG